MTPGFQFINRFWSAKYSQNLVLKTEYSNTGAKVHLNIWRLWWMLMMINSLFRLTTRKIPKLHNTDPLLGESTGHQWIPHTKGQLCIESFHVMMSPCIMVILFSIMGRGPRDAELIKLASFTNATLLPKVLLTPKWLGHFFQNVISFNDAGHLMSDSFIWNWSNTMNV